MPLKIYEKENLYLKVGFERNPFSMSLEPQIVKDFIFQREANRVFSIITKNPRRTHVVWLGPECLPDDYSDFLTFLAQNFLFSVDSSWFFFDLSSAALTSQRMLGVFTNIRSRIEPKNVARIFSSYLLEKLLGVSDAGMLAETFSPEEAAEFVEKAQQTKGIHIIEFLTQKPELPPKPAENATEEEKAVYSEARKSVEELIEKQQALRELYYRLIEADRLGAAATTALRHVLQRGLDDAVSNLIPRDAKMDLIGMMKFLSYSYSRIVAFLYGVGMIPFLDEDEIIDYRSLLVDAESTIRQFANVVYIIRPSDLLVAEEIIEEKPKIEPSFDTSFLEIENPASEIQAINTDEKFSALAHYMVGAWSDISGELLKFLDEAAKAAYSKAGGDARQALFLLERAFDRAAEEGTFERFYDFVKEQ